MRVIELRAEAARMLPCADPCGRRMYIGCGVALFNVRLATAVAGCRPVVQPFPDPDEPLLLGSYVETRSAWASDQRTLWPQREIY